jgi:hypothetical protein
MNGARKGNREPRRCRGRNVGLTFNAIFAWYFVWMQNSSLTGLEK